MIGAASIGRNVTIFSGVTMGAKKADLGFEIFKATDWEQCCDCSGVKIIGA